MQLFKYLICHPNIVQDFLEQLECNCSEKVANLDLRRSWAADGPAADVERLEIFVNVSPQEVRNFMQLLARWSSAYKATSRASRGVNRL
jgi:hypothetical protein